MGPMGSGLLASCFWFQRNLSSFARVPKGHPAQKKLGPIQRQQQRWPSTQNPSLNSGFTSAPVVVRAVCE